MSDFHATLDAWRERGADRFDPVRFRIIEAMERRAIEHDGETRRVLNARLTELIDAFASDLAANVQPKAPDGESASGPLGGLIDYLANTRAPDAYPEMAALEYFRETWNRISTERQFRQSLAQVPGNAGPLNSSSLVHRALSLMRELSPGYLQQFLSYADALSWLEQMNTASGTAADQDALGARPPRKPLVGNREAPKTINQEQETKLPINSCKSTRCCERETRILKTSPAF